MKLSEWILFLVIVIPQLVAGLLLLNYAVLQFPGALGLILGLLALASPMSQMLVIALAVGNLKRRIVSQP
ncbi:hypothetical protein ANRL4_03406 [Anaerolineae bacterium]|nr:hypothetical protein ANRL4_03406 [Anaerolineae bacterium]